MPTDKAASTAKHIADDNGGTSAVPELEPLTRGVLDKYRHELKEVRVRGPVHIGGALLEWYEIAPAHASIPEPIVEQAREFASARESSRTASDVVNWLGDKSSGMV